MSFDETYLPRDIGEKAAENGLEAEPVFALLKSCSRADGLAELLDTEAASVGYCDRAGRQFSRFASDSATDPMAIEATPPVEP